ncbi:calcium-binding protein [Phenylobacterium deserti]|uniref:Calcium-binding protein n=1 Tax=Phenylobacterium deserti TaxID=1914756 RepID=A0A328A8Q3_9CAUL|nr:calcium-binding protein [Phenylobacterium deserti]RAK50992.1 calcium-binding protein [Phenylobacterium deserti]
MAALTLGSEFAYLATIDPNNPPEAVAASASSTQIVGDLSDGSRLTITGTGFTYDSFGEPVGGTVTGLQITHGGALAFSLSNIALPVATFADYLDTVEPTVLLTSLLSGPDTITVQTQVGVLVSGYDGNDTMQGGAGFEFFNGNQGDDVIDGGSGGGDWLVGGKGADRITAHAGSGVLYGNIGADTLNGGSGAETIRGGQDDDVLLGGGGADWLSGDRGSDTITGGAGADIFHQSAGAGLDRITDFNLAEGDRIQLDLGQVYSVSQVGADTVIDLGGGDQMVLAGVSQASLTGSWIFLA